MKALVVYESMYGNTAAIGEGIAASLRAHAVEASAGPISMIEPSETEGVDLLVVGGPTHAHGMSHAATRKAGATDEKNTYQQPTVEPGLREWMDRLPPGEGRLAAAFDTRFDKPVFVTGSAAKGIARRLRKRGYGLVAEPESFFVTTQNVLQDGEAEHATSWAAMLPGRRNAAGDQEVRRTA
jgi:hypothetical protein